LTERYVLAADGTLNYSDAWRDGIRTQHVNYDRHGAVRVVTELRPGTREPLARRRYTASGRLFMSERIDDGGAVTACVIGGPGDTGGELVPVLDLQYRWIAALAVGQHAVFLCEARALDGHAAVLNPYLPPGGLRTVASIHSNHLRPPYDDPQSVWTFNDWALSHAADFSAVVVLTRMQREEIALHYGESGTMVDIGHPVVPARLRRSLRARVGSLVRRPPRVVLVTRLAQVKRLGDVLQAFRLVVDQIPTAKMEIWGTGDQQESLEKLAAELGLKRRVRFAGYTHDAAGAFRRGQVSISTSISEGLGMSTLESLAAGTPVVAYDYRYGPRDLITHGRDGYVVPNGDVEALAAAVARILARPARARLMGAWALRVRLTRSVRRYRKQWVALIDSTEHGAAHRRLPSRGGEANRTSTPPEQGAASR
ncbi:MAG TPA: glycosyltransferase, partial [Cellulomonas sp.]|nr:glycosyltransferase [Cellulomonas sp.]